MDGLNTALPFGVRKIDAIRTLTTESALPYLSPSGCMKFITKTVFTMGRILSAISLFIIGMQTSETQGLENMQHVMYKHIRCNREIHYGYTNEEYSVLTHPIRVSKAEFGNERIAIYGSCTHK